MDIYITEGVGSGRTEKSAFDAALFDAGVANYNILELSSVIPDGSRIIVEKINRNAVSEHGHKLYAVLAHQTAGVRGEGAYAGIGWVKDERTDGGLFVEHHGKTEDEVGNLIRFSLEDMVQYRKTHKFGPIGSKIAGTKCDGDYACALVCAYYESQDWDTKVKEKR